MIFKGACLPALRCRQLQLIITISTSWNAHNFRIARVLKQTLIDFTGNLLNLPYLICCGLCPSGNNEMKYENQLQAHSFGNSGTHPDGGYGTGLSCTALEEEKQEG